MKSTTYYPSHFTINTLEGFGTRKIPWRQSKSKLKKPFDSKVPDFVKRKKKTYDKQNLLQQIRQQKKRNNIVRASTVQLLRSLSKSKQIVRENQDQVIIKSLSKSRVNPLKRQIQYLIKEVQNQTREIEDIKQSKKYNRVLELQTLKKVYQQEIKGLKVKLRSFKHEIRRQRKSRKGYFRRKADTTAINKQVELRLQLQNMQLANKIQKIDQIVQTQQTKLLKQKQEKKRLMKQIYQLQRQTGKIYLKQSIDQSCNQSQPQDQSCDSSYRSQNHKGCEQSYDSEFQDGNEEDDHNMRSV